MGISGCFPWGKPAATVALPNIRCFSVSIIHRTLDMDYRIFDVRTDVNACDCTRGCTNTVRESALKADCGREEKSLAAPGNRTSVSGVPVRCSTNWVNLPPHCLSVFVFLFCFSFFCVCVETVVLSLVHYSSLARLFSSFCLVSHSHKQSLASLSLYLSPTLSLSLSLSL